MNKFEKIRQEHIGKRYWNLTVLEYVSRKEGYLLQCDCGKTSTYRLSRVLSGDVKSCGSCWKKGRPKLPNNLGAKKAVRERYRQSAKRRGIDFLLTDEEVWGIISSNCSYCGAPPATDMKLPAHPTFRYTGIDRVNNSLPYTSSNCVPACTMCNMSKLYHNKDEWLSWVKRVHNYQFRTFND